MRAMPAATQRARKDERREGVPLASLLGDVRYQLARLRAQRHDMVAALLGGRAGLAPDGVCEVDIGPSHAQRLAAAAPGQQQQPDDIGGLLIRVLGQRLGQPLQLVAAQKSPALALVVALDVSARVVAAHAPAHRKREHFRDQRERSVSSKRLALCGEAAVQTVDVGEGDVADLGVQAEEGTHMVAQRATILARRARGFSREMLGREPVAQLGDRGSGALLLEIAERVDAAIYLLLQPLGLLPRRRGPPDRGRPYGEPALAAGAASAVVEDERPGAGGGDAAAEPWKIAVVMDLAALLGSGESLNDRVGKPRRHLTPPCPNSIRRFDGIPCPIYGEACPGLSTRKTRRGAGFFHRHERNADAARASQTPPEQTEFLGPNPVGYINYGADGRMLVLTVASGRRKPAGPKATSTEVEALFRSMTSYGGTYTIHGNELTHHVDVSWNQSWTGTDQKRVARFDGNRVDLSTPPSLDPITGMMSMRTMTWEKLG